MQQYPNDPVSPGTPPTPPAWGGQPGSGQQGAPSWVGQGAAPSFGVQATLLDRSKPWPVLRLISRVLKIIAWIELVIGTLASLIVGISGIAGGAAVASYGGSMGGGLVFLGFLAMIAYFIGTALGFMSLYGFAEIILVFLAIEKNTRKGE